MIKCTERNSCYNARDKNNDDLPYLDGTTGFCIKEC